MGSTFPFQATRASVIERVLSPRCGLTLASAVRGDVVWAVKELHPEHPEFSTRRVYIACFLIQRGHDRDYRWGYRDLCESMGLREVTCPLRFLEMSPPVETEIALRWRARVREYHARVARERAARRSIRVGQRIALREGLTPSALTITRLKPLQGRDDSGREFRVQPRHIDFESPGRASTASA